MFDDDDDVLRFVHAKPEFKPQYLKSESQYENGSKERLDALNSVIEILALWKYVEKEALHNYSSMYSKLSNPLSNIIKHACQRHKENFAVYDGRTKAWLLKPSEPKCDYSYCYDGLDFVDFTVAQQTGDRLLLVGKYTIIMQEPNFLSATDIAHFYFPGFVMPSIKLITGVPGCGKTTYIIENHEGLVLTSGKESAQDIRSRMAELEGCDPSDYTRSFKTIDSYLLHSRDMFLSVWVDEALMEHPGKLFLVCLFSQCRQLCLLGDPNQLGYINRTDAKLQYDKSSKFFKPTQILNVSHRCPADVMAILSRHYSYDGGAYSATSVLRSLMCLKFTSLKDVPNSIGTKYLVFKQAEKKQMKAQGYDVSTVHEYQGKEAARVVLVKMSHNTQPSQCESDSHLLVAMSRHRESLVYYTPVKDKLNKIICEQFTDAELSKHQIILPVNTNSKTEYGNDAIRPHILNPLESNSHNKRNDFDENADYLIDTSTNQAKDYESLQNPYKDKLTMTKLIVFVACFAYGSFIGRIFAESNRMKLACVVALAAFLYKFQRTLFAK